MRVQVDVNEIHGDYAGCGTHEFALSLEISEEQARQLQAQLDEKLGKHTTLTEISKTVHAQIRKVEAKRLDANHLEDVIDRATAFGFADGARWVTQPILGILEGREAKVDEP